MNKTKRRFRKRNAKIRRQILRKETRKKGKHLFNETHGDIVSMRRKKRGVYGGRNNFII